MVWAGTGLALVALERRPADRARFVSVAGRREVAVGFAALVTVLGLVAYPIFDGRSASGGGSDADDGVFLVLDGIRDGTDPYAATTYLGNAATTGPGSGLWFLPFGTRALYPLGIAAAVALSVGIVRWRHGRWTDAGVFAVLLGASVPFWEGVGQGSDHLVFGCSLVWAATVLDRSSVVVRRPALVAVAVLVGTLATSRAVFGFVPVLAAAALWWRDRRGALLFGGIGTAIALALHGWLIGRSGWDGYDPVQQLFVKSGDELPGRGKAILVLGLLVGGVLVVRELTRKADARATVLLLAGVGAPMSAVALAGLTTESIEVWSGANYMLDAVALAAYWFTTRLLPEPRPAPLPPPR